MEYIKELEISSQIEKEHEIEELIRFLDKLNKESKELLIMKKMRKVNRLFRLNNENK